MKGIILVGRGFFWLDAGTHDPLANASQYGQLLENRQSVRVACVEEIAWRMGCIDREACYRLGQHLAKSRYGEYLMELTVPPRFPSLARHATTDHRSRRTAQPCPKTTQ